MWQWVKKGVDYYAGNFRPGIQDGVSGIRQVGHRAFVGGDFERGGEQQFALCLKHGLQPADIVLDVACGALRLGLHLIPFLTSSHYIGFDRESLLIDAGLEELRARHGQSILDEKQPRFVVSERFDFGALPAPPTFCVAFSLFTHLDARDLERCLTHLRAGVAVGTPFYCSFADSPLPLPQLYRSHSHRNFLYTHGEMARIGKRAGWHGQFVGSLNSHRIFHYTAA